MDRVAAARELTALASRLANVAAALATSQESSPATGRLLDARKVASVLDTTPHAVYELHRIGELPGVRVGKRRLRFREEDVEAYCSRREK
jgi:excisionase family DNA binding protein